MLVSDIYAVDGSLNELRLNPCFSGCWSRTAARKAAKASVKEVLILVLVDVGLGR